MTSPSIFISYRRDDTQAWAGRMADYLIEKSNARILIDVDAVAFGQDYTKAIRDQISASDIILVMIGSHWLSARGRKGFPRLQDPDDPVRLEVKWALEGDKLVVPVLVDGAEMPAREELPVEIGDLSVRNGLTLGHTGFKRDLDQLLLNLQHAGVRLESRDDNVPTFNRTESKAPALPTLVAADSTANASKGTRTSGSKRPYIAGLLSCVPGLGQLYVGGHLRRAAAFLAGSILILVAVAKVPAFTLVLLVFWLWNIYDAYHLATVTSRRLGDSAQ